MNIDPLRERDLPDSERMLSRILSTSADDTVEMGIEHLGEPVRQPRRLLQVAAAAAVVVAIGGIGWSVTQPNMTGAQPGGRPGLAPALTPTPTPGATESQEAGSTPSRTPQPTRPATTPTPVPTPKPPVGGTPSATATPTPTPSNTPTPTPSTTPSPSPSPRPQRPSIAVVNSSTFEISDTTYLTINYRVCAGSAPATLRGPLIAGVRPNAANGSAAIGSPLVDGTAIKAGNCQVFSDTWQTEVQSGRVSVHITPSGEPESEWTDYYAAGFG